MVDPTQKTLVLKFGGAAVATSEHFARIAEIIRLRRKDYRRIAVVVSAMGDTTDELLALAHKVNPAPPQRELDMLVSVGERISAALLAMALAKIGIQAVSFTGSQTGVITCDHHNDARIIAVKPDRLLPHLQAGEVVLVAGFQGVSEKREITTLGRGGSDTTAVALAAALDADRVEFYKDVPGVFDEDPKIKKDADLIPQLSYDEMLSMSQKGSAVLAARCVGLAAKNGIPLVVRSFKSVDEECSGTLITTKGACRSGRPVYEEV